MAKRTKSLKSSSAVPPPAAAPVRDVESDASRVAAFIARIELTRDIRPYDVQDRCERGRRNLEQLVLARAEGWPLKLSPEQCADILTFMDHCEPIDPETWWADKDEVSHVCGYHMVLGAMAESLRKSPL